MKELMIKYWENEELREEGISELYDPNTNNLNEAIAMARKLIDREGFASVEVVVPSNEDEEVLFFYDGVTEELF